MISFVAVSLTGCRCLIRTGSEPETLMVDEIQGSYSYKDASDSYSGKLLLRSADDMLAVDIFGPMYFLAAAIRHNQDSTLVYLALQSELLILPPNSNLPFEGWELPIGALYSGYSGSIPTDSDSVVNSDSTEDSDSTVDNTIQVDDTLEIYAGDLIYFVNAKSQRLMRIQGENWKLDIEGTLHRSEDKPEPPRKITFTKEDVQLSFTFDYLEVNQREKSKAFGLNVPDDVEVIDYR